jgi:hypothetical protein
MTIERLRAVLNAIGPPVTTMQLAEMLWLAAHLPADGQQAGVAAEPAGAGDGETADDTGPRTAITGQEQPSAVQPETADEKREPLHTPPAPGEGPGADAETLLVPTAPMLRHPRAIQRALRPLKRRVPSRRHRVLDEDATAAWVADRPRDRPWTPVLVPARERWLSLALVVDVGAAMDVWQPLIGELREALFRLGAFRDVRVWLLAHQDDKVGVRSSPGGPVMDPAALVDPTGRQAVLLFSDCSGPHWWRGRMGPAVYHWAAHGPTAILQPLAERLWRRTAAPTVPGLAVLARPGAPNTALRFTPHGGQVRQRPGTVAVPVLELSPVWLADWAGLVTASGEARDTAVTYQSDRVLPFVQPLIAERELPVADRIRRFHAVASPEAAELAAHAAVAVPSLPVMQLIQQRIVPQSGPSDLAELLLSGLLRPVDAVPGLYDFIPGARAALLETLPRPESLATTEVLRQIAEEIHARAGSAARTFQAVMRVAEGIGDHSFSPENRPFALVSAEALRILHPTAMPSDSSAIRPGGAVAAEDSSVLRSESPHVTAVGDPASPHRPVGPHSINVPVTINARHTALVLPPEVMSALPETAKTPTRRIRERNELLNILARTDDDRRAGQNSAAVISGPAAVGKTVLMMQTARVALRRGWFPGGVLFADMHGYAETGSVEAGQALGTLLETLGLEAGHIPPGTEDRAALYRSVLAAEARQGRRILVLIDNAATTGQVVPLLPDDANSKVIITSRSPLEIPRAHMLALHDTSARSDIGLWGAPGSGKTTFIAAFYIAVNRSSLDINFFGDNDESLDFIVTSNRTLTYDHKFPAATIAANPYEWTINVIAEREIPDGSSESSSQAVVRQQFSIGLLDTAGSFFAGPSVALSPQSSTTRETRLPAHGNDIALDDAEIIDYLAGCGGLLLFIDPTRERVYGDTLGYFQNTLLKIAQRRLATLPAGSRLPHYVAVCITKFDHPDVYRFARLNGFLSYDENDPFMFPRVHDDDAERFLHELCGPDVSDADMISAELRRYFHPDRVRYFVTSAIGFYRRGGGFREDDFANVVEQDGQIRVRGQIHPINVFEPILWLGQNIGTAK